MNSARQEELTDLIIGWVRDNRLPSDFPNPKITENTDLMAGGLLDSFGFVDLVLFIEQQTGIKIDLADADPSEFAVVKGLCKIVLSSPIGDHQQPVDIALSPDLQQQLLD